MASSRDRVRIDATARAVIECAADAIIAFGSDRTVTLWNPAAERLFGWKASEVVGLELAFIPQELQAENNAVLEHVASGGQTIGWVSVCQQTAGDEAVKHYMAERARVVRRLGDVVADMNAQLELSAVLDRIAASLRELTRADAGGFVLIEGDRLRLVSIDGLPAELRGRTADLPTSLVAELMRSGNTVLMRTGE